MTLRTLKALTFTLALTAASNAFADAAQLLSEDLQAGIKTLPRETRLYHYFGINLPKKADGTTVRLEDTNLKDAAKRYELVQKRLNYFSDTFFDLKNNTTHFANAGLGLYLAIDPFSSSPAAAADTGANFGSVMMEVTFNAGSRYLDLLKDIPLRDETIQAIVSETAMTEADAAKLILPRTEPGGKVSHKGFARDTLQYMAEAQNEAFRKLVHAVYVKNEITLTEYGWQAATSAFCGSTSPHRSALVYVGGTTMYPVIKSVTMVYLDENSALLDAQEAEALERNKKLFSVLQPLRPLEKSYQSIADQAYSLKKSGDKVSAKEMSAQLPGIISNIQATISAVYPDQAEADDLRSKTFECVK